MSSRQEQKERRKKEREERERREKAAAQRKQLAQIAGGAVIVIAVIVGIVLAASGGGGGGGNTGERLDGDAPDPLPVPAQRETNLLRAVKKAKCAFREFPDEGNTHVDDELTAKDFKTNPPTSGNHNQVWSEDGFYPASGTPALKNSVHALEHGRIEIQYKRGLSLTYQRKLRTLFNENGRYHMLMFQNNSGMKYEVAAVAWTRYVVCNKMNDDVYDAFRIFRTQFTDKGPEQVP